MKVSRVSSRNIFSLPVHKSAVMHLLQSVLKFSVSLCMHSVGTWTVVRYWSKVRQIPPSSCKLTLNLRPEKHEVW